MESLKKTVAVLVLIVVLVAIALSFFPREDTSQAQTSNLVMYAQSNFDNGNVLNFSLPGSNSDPLCPGGICSGGISVVNDPTGQLSGKVARINYTRTSLAGAKDDNSGIQSRSMSVGFSQPLYVEWDVVLPYPDISGCAAATVYDSGHCGLNTQRKLLYIQTRGNDSPFVIKIHGGSRISTGTKCVGADLNCVFNLEANDPTNPNNSKGITKIKGTDLWGKKQHFEVELFTNSSPTTADGRMKISLNGTVLVDRSDMLLLQTTRPYILVWIGQQVSVTYDDMLLNEDRYLDNALVSNIKPGTTYVPPPPPPPSAPSVTLSASPSSITAGGSSTLTWTSTNATVCANNFNGTGISGTKAVTPSVTTDYTITCTGSGGSNSRTTRVTVSGVINPAPTVTLSASHTAISTGQSSTLTWSSTNATSCTSNFGTVGISGTKTVTPTTNTTYTITCTGSGGSTPKSVTVSVSALIPPTAPSATLSASPTALTAGQATILTWTSTNATSCTSNFGTVSTNGSKTLTPSVSTTYTITCTGAGGSTPPTSAAVTVSSTPLPISNTLPVISNVTVSSISSSQATITWNTDIPSDSQVRYGLNTSYGSLSSLDTNLTTSHSVKINKLSPSTTYYYRVISKSAGGLSTESGDQNFHTTTKPGKPFNLKAVIAAVSSAVESIIEAVRGVFKR